MRLYWPIRNHKTPNATGFLDPGYYAGYPNSAGVPTFPAVKGYWHTGTDYNGPGAGNADQGNGCYAVASGKIVFVGQGGGTWGNLVVVEFVYKGRTYWARYGHVQFSGNGPARSPRVGQAVQAGELLAYIGRGGPYNNAFFAHLHFDILHTRPPSWGWWPARYAGQSTVTRYALDPDTFLRSAGAVEP